MDANEIIRQEEADRLAWEAKTVAFEVAGVPVTMATARKTFDRVQNDKHWKLPWAAKAPCGAVELVLKAAAFYGNPGRAIGVEPITGLVLLAGDGYQG